MVGALRRARVEAVAALVVVAAVSFRGGTADNAPW